MRERGLLKNWMRKSGAAGIALCTAAIFIGCGSSAFDTASSAYQYETSSEKAAPAENYYDAEYETGTNGAGAVSEMADLQNSSGGAEETEEPQVADTSRKLIRNVTMNVETKEFDIMLETVQNRVKELGGYIESMDVYNGSAYSYYRSARNSSLTIRIPQNNLEEFLDSVSDIGNVTDRSDSVEDITLKYVDTESRKEALVIEQERLLALLERAESIEDIITIESRLSEVRYQLESIESKLRTYDNQVDYSTVYMYIDEVKELTPVEEKSTLQRMGEGFAGSLRSIGRDIVEFAVWFVVHIPYIVIWVVVITIIVLALRAFKRRTKRIKERERQAASEQLQARQQNDADPEKR